MLRQTDFVGAGTASPDSIYKLDSITRSFKTNFIYFPFTGNEPVATLFSVSDSQKAQ